jgi:hypothetical protein
VRLRSRPRRFDHRTAAADHLDGHRARIADPEAICSGELASVYAKLGWRMSPVAWWPKRCSRPTVAAWAQVTPWIDHGTQFVALVEDPARDGCRWIALPDGKVADS